MTDGQPSAEVCGAKTDGNGGIGLHLLFAALNALLALAILAYYGTYGPRGIGSVCAFLPALFFLCAGRFHNRAQQKSLTRWLVHSLLYSLALWCLVGLAQIPLAYAGVTTDTTKYGTVLGRMDHRLTAHFPPAIPATARNIRMEWSPGFLQGGTYLQLRYEDSPERIQSVEQQYTTVASRRYSGGGMFTHLQEDGGMPTTWFYTSGGAGREFPADYTLLVLDAPPATDMQRSHAGMNHGQTHGIAISRMRNEVIFWADAW